MASAREKLNKDGSLEIKNFITEELTHLLTRLHDFKVVMLTEEKNHYSDTIESMRNDIFEIRCAVENCDIKYKTLGEIISENLHTEQR